jgi:hypothetical protein
MTNDEIARFINNTQAFIQGNSDLRDPQVEGWFRTRQHFIVTLLEFRGRFHRGAATFRHESCGVSEFLISDFPGSFKVMAIEPYAF